MTQNAIQAQCAQIKAHLLAGKSISQAQAIADYGCYRLGARIHELRCEGMEIETDSKSAVNRFGKKVRFAVYRLGGGHEQLQNSD